MKEIKLTQGYVAIVDDEDYDRVSVYRWHAQVIVRSDNTTRIYAMRNVRKPDGVWTVQQIQRLIMDPPPLMQVDHINGNALDNRRSNLRICTNAENQRNRTIRIGGSSGFKGVHWDRDTKKWRSQIRVNEKGMHLGLFVSELDAARAYDNAAIDNFGEFARVNTYEGAS